MIKRNSIYSILCISYFDNNWLFRETFYIGPNDGMLKVESVPLHNASGWGYEILVDHKIFIHQEYIPAIAGKKAFLTKEDAMKTAGLVIEKLVKGKQPAITKNDLTALKISFQ